MPNYLTRGQMKAARSRLTRARNSGDHQRVVDVVGRQFNEWDDGDYAYPDDWSTWQIASDDAHHALGMLAPYLARF